MKKKIFVLTILLIVVITIIGTSYAYLKAERVSENDPSISIANFGVILLTDMNSINIDKTYPMSDSEGLLNQSTTFQIQNTGSQIANYKVSLVDNETVKSTMQNEDVRYQLKRTNETTKETVTFDITNLDSTGLLDEGSITAGTILTYEIVMWIDYDSNPNGQTFSKVVLVEGMQVASLDTSGANYPELLDNMIPVYYEATSDTEGVWKKADSKNLDSNYQWFDYDNYMWANAVTVKETGTKTRSEYLNSAVGTEINMDDITSMWVWIPRYKYVIFNGNNGSVDEQLIDVTFEHGIDKTGTVACVDNIQTSSSSSSSETCTDATNGSIINGVSTYTHPAFTFGDEELTGFWFAKFEMSTDDTTCLNSQSETNCNKSDINIYVKPDELSLRYISVSNLFENTRGMELSGNIHGFSQSVEAATLNNDGTITNDNNNYDIHMEKNMEWGAVAYLSQSKYGKYGNTLYEGDYRRIYKNNYYQYTNSIYYFKTGYSGYSETASGTTTNTVLYNDLTDLGNGQGYKGAGASTTGTIYGVYDMNGGSYDYVMGNMVNTSGTFYSSSSGFASPYPNSKYYDKYSYSTSSNSVASRSRSKFGDGIKETIKNMTNTSSGAGWEYYGIRNMPNSINSWFTRGGSAYNSSYLGVFFSSYGDGTGNYANASSRPVLAISREFPWLNE